MTNEHSSEEEGGLTPEEILNAEQFDESSEDDEVDIVTQLQSEVASLRQSGRFQVQNLQTLIGQLRFHS